MAMKKLDLAEIGRRGLALLKESKEVLSGVNFERIKKLSERIPDSLSFGGSSPKVVFTGEYNAGKSSLIRLLTRQEDIGISNTITTDKARMFEWSGLEIWDTPGIHTELRPEHDEISYAQIVSADLLIWVTTCQLMDSHLASKFRELAVDKDKIHEMMIVVNWMSMHGNTPELQKTLLKELKRFTSPYAPDDLFISFTDAKYAEESLSEEDPKVAAEDWEEGGLDGFIENLNRFVEERGLAGKYTTSLYELEHTLVEALSLLSVGDPTLDGLEELLVQKRREFVDARRTTLRESAAAIGKAASKVRDLGRSSAELIDVSSKTGPVNRKLKKAQQAVDELAAGLSEELKDIHVRSLQDLGEKVERLSQTELGKQVMEMLERTFEQADVSPEAAKRAKLVGKGAHSLGNFLVRNAFDPNAGTLGGILAFRSYSGTAMHSMVKEVGHFFGVKFWPWEAVKWTKRIADAGRVLAVAGLVVSVVGQVLEDKKNDQRAEELRKARYSIRSGFNDASDSIEMHYDEQSRKFVSEVFGSELTLLDEQLKELREDQQQNEEHSRKIADLLASTRSLIEEIHASG